MIRRLLRFGIRLGLAGGVGYALFKVVQARRAAPAGMPSGDTAVMPKRSETPLVAPDMLKGVTLKRDESADDTADANGQAEPTAAAAAVPAASAVPPAPPPPPAPAEASTSEARAEPTAGGGWVEPDGTNCPPGHPVKAKMQSGIYHLPGMTQYDRTTPDRCYVDEAAAEADGLRKAKR